MTTSISTNVEDLSMFTVDAATHSVEGWNVYQTEGKGSAIFEIDGNGYDWYESVTHTDDEGRTHTLVVSNGTVVGLYVDGRLYEAHEYDEYEDKAPESHLDENEFEALFDLELSDAEGPMMNYWYECPAIDNPREAAGKLVGLPLCVVELESADTYGLALTGGGQDHTWEIVAAYVALGALPPYRFAADLPGIAGRGQSEADKVLIAACLRTLEVTAKRARYAADRLQESAAQWAAR